MILLALLIGACSSTHHSATSVSNIELTIVMSSNAKPQETAAVQNALRTDPEVSRWAFQGGSGYSQSIGLFPGSSPAITSFESTGTFRVYDVARADATKVVRKYAAYRGVARVLLLRP